MTFDIGKQEEIGMVEIEQKEAKNIEFVPSGGMTVIPEVGDLVPRRGGKLARGFAKFMMSLFGWQVEGVVPNAEKFMVIGAPHTSYWDWFIVMGAAYTLGARISWMSKHSLFEAPWGGLLKYLGGVPVDRRRSTGVVASVVEQFKKHDKLILCITPEGTRAKVRSQWKKGFYYIAQGADVPVVVAAFDFGRKVVRFGPTFKPSGNVEADLPTIMSYYDGIAGRHPQKEVE